MQGAVPTLRPLRVYQGARPVIFPEKHVDKKNCKVRHLISKFHFLGHKIKGL